MTIRARVELVGSSTHHSNWRRFVKNQPQILTNPAEIQYYQNQSGFNVVLLENETKKKVVETPLRMKPIKKVDEEINQEEDYDESEEDEDEDEDEGYTESSLRELKKSQLKAIANDMDLDIEGTRKELIARIIESTN